ncbi:hypothetical protein VTJ83DRAFT_503 [Remersonia thermophila]|uniref:Uncharacterized protein n=1 Tax=Remersonia thermophila TaxID=72144 RepID=A0ABR4DLC2_9PEZI
MAVPSNSPPPGPPYQASPPHQAAPYQASSPQSSPSHPAQQKVKGRRSRTFSFLSDKSRRSSQKIDLHETSAEKEARRLHSKADPTLAIQEAEPAEVAAMVESSLAPLRSIQHKDAYGNPILDPDRSNPTRSRWERPLETIRSFEAAIDGGYNRRSIVARQDEGSANRGPSRRASYHYGSGNGYGGRYAYDNGYYGSRPSSVMYSMGADMSAPDLVPGPVRYRESYYEHQPGYGGYPQQGYNRRGRMPRMPPPEPPYGAPYRQYSPHRDYALPSNHRSYETVTTASGSGSSAEPAGYQTDPTSSDNSSIERAQSVPRRPSEQAKDYGTSHGQGPSYQPQPSLVSPTPASVPISGAVIHHTNGTYSIKNTSSNLTPPPPVPVKNQGTVLRKPVAASAVQEVQQPAKPEKRKSWLARRFSRRG